MARLFRLYGKKRGDRRTGSHKVGSAGEVLFFSFFLGIGVFSLLWLLFRWIIPEWHVYHGFVATTGLVAPDPQNQQTHLLEQERIDGRLRYRPQIHVQYEAAGRSYERWTYDITGEYRDSKDEAEAILARFRAGDRTDCFYDPADPATVVLVREFSWWLWIALLVPASFMIIGGAGLIRSLFLWGRSAEQRSLDLRRVAALNPLMENESAPHLPYVPHGGNLTNSPGTTLAYRLPTSTSPGFRLFALGAASVIWNGVILTLLVLYLTGSLRADPSWVLWILFAVAIPAGWGLVYLFVRELLLTSGGGPTLVEISDHPLLPGERYEVFLSQTGKLSLKSMRLDVECEEEATYRQGTDTRTDRRRVFQQTLWQRKQFNIEQGLPFEVRCELRLPPQAMHSFKADFNAVLWKLVVRADVADWPSFERSFPLVIHPRKELPT